MPRGIIGFDCIPQERSVNHAAREPAGESAGKQQIQVTFRVPSKCHPPADLSVALGITKENHSANH